MTCRAGDCIVPRLVPTLNIFIDESGNFDFSEKGTKYFLLTAVSTTGCHDLFSDFFQLKHRLAGEGLGLEEFHATEDRQSVRDQVYGLIERHCLHRCLSIDAVIVQKGKATPELREETVFYTQTLRALLEWVFRHRPTDEVDRIVVWAARIGTSRKRGTFEKAIKTYLANLEANHPYQIFIHSSASHPMLQVADYCSWALMKRWRDGEIRPYSRIASAVLKELELFQTEADSLREAMAPK